MGIISGHKLTSQFDSIHCGEVGEINRNEINGQFEFGGFVGDGTGDAMWLIGAIWFYYHIVNKSLCFWIMK